MRKYNPDYDKNIVDNFRRAFEEKYKEKCNHTDEEIYNVYETCWLDEDVDASVLEELKNTN